MSKKKSLTERLESRLNKIDKLEKSLNNALAKRYKKDIEENIIKRVIEDFYDDYTPKLYKRKYSLRKAYKFTVNNGVYTIDYNSKYMTRIHRASNEYIYNLAFISGYHGGATSISDAKLEKWASRGVDNTHPSPANYYGGDTPISGGTPYYRTPPQSGLDEDGVWRPKYYKWGYEAEQSKSPYERIEKEIYKYEEGIPAIKKEIFKKEVIKWLYR